MYIWNKRGRRLFLSMFLFFLVSSPLIVVCAVEEKQPFANIDSDLTADLQNNVRIDADIITVTLNPTESLVVPLFAKHSPTSLSFNATLLGGCARETQWQLKYPSGEANCALIAEWSDRNFRLRDVDTKESIGSVDADAFADTEVIMDDASVNLKHGGAVSPKSLSCAVSAFEGLDGYAMNLHLEYMLGSCSVQLKFDRQKFQLRSQQSAKKGIVPSSNRGIHKTNATFWISIFVPLGIVLILASSAILILIYCFYWKIRRDFGNNCAVDLEKGHTEYGPIKGGQPKSNSRKVEQSALTAEWKQENSAAKSVAAESESLERMPQYREAMDRIEEIMRNPPNKTTGADHLARYIAANIAYKYYKEMAAEKRRQKMGLRRSDEEKAAYKKKLTYYVTCSLRPKTQLTYDENMDEDRPVIRCPHLFHSDSEGSGKKRKNTVNLKSKTKTMNPRKDEKVKRIT